MKSDIANSPNIKKRRNGDEEEDNLSRSAGKQDKHESIEEEIQQEEERMIELKKRRKEEKEEKKYGIEDSEDLVKELQEFKEICKEQHRLLDPKKNLSEEDKFDHLFERLNLSSHPFQDEAEIQMIMSQASVGRDLAVKISVLREQISRERRWGREMSDIIRRFAAYVQDECFVEHSQVMEMSRSKRRISYQSGEGYGKEKMAKYLDDKSDVPFEKIEYEIYRNNKNANQNINDFENNNNDDNNDDDEDDECSCDNCKPKYEEVVIPEDDGIHQFMMNNFDIIELPENPRIARNNNNNNARQARIIFGRNQLEFEEEEEDNLERERKRKNDKQPKYPNLRKNK